MAHNIYFAKNMKTIKYILKLACLSLMLASCSSHPAEEDIHEVVTKFYSGPIHDFREADQTLMTQQLSDLVTQALQKEDRETQKILKSAYPTDKPKILEGHVFSGLYEGFHHFKILKIKVKENKAQVKIQFTNTDFKKSWIDQIHLVQEDTWKIDNVIYKKNMNAHIHSQGMLKSYINFSKD